MLWMKSTKTGLPVSYDFAPLNLFTAEPQAHIKGLKVS